MMKLPIYGRRLFFNGFGLKSVVTELLWCHHSCVWLARLQRKLHCKVKQAIIDLQTEICQANGNLVIIDMLF